MEKEIDKKPADVERELPDIIRNIHNLLPSLPKNFQEKFKESQEIENRNAHLLSTYGWYLSARMKYGSVLEIFKAINNNDISGAEKILLKYYTDNIDDIKNELIGKFADRKELIVEAFKAHKQKMYFSSTILFLSQG